MDPRDAINQIKNSGCIELMLDKQPHKALYLVGMVNYLSNKYNLNLNIHKYDGYKLREMAYPQSIELMPLIMNTDSYKKDAIKTLKKSFCNLIFVKEKLNMLHNKEKILTKNNIAFPFSCI